MTVTADWQFEWNGVKVGPGTSYDVESVEGLADLPDLRTSDIPAIQDHGEYLGTDRIGGRTVILTIGLTEASAAALAAAVDTLTAAWVMDSTSRALVFRVPGRANQQVHARVRRRSLPLDMNFDRGTATLVYEFRAGDPRIYSELEDNTDINPGAAESVLNGGSVSAPYVAKIHGPVTNPTLTAGGNVTSLTGTIAFGDWVEIDSLNRSVVTDTGANYYGNVSSFDLLSIPAGGIVVGFAGSATGGTTKVTFTVRDTWV